VLPRSAVETGARTAATAAAIASTSAAGALPLHRSRAVAAHTWKTPARV
jgi:hypothetical protein